MLIPSFFLKKILHFSCWQKRILEYTKYELLNKALQAFEDLRDDEELGPADWPTVENYILSLKDSEGEQVHPHSDSQSGNLDHTSLKDTRIRFLNGNYHVSFHLLYYFIRQNIDFVQVSCVHQVFRQLTGRCLMREEYLKILLIFWCGQWMRRWIGLLQSLYVTGEV